MLHRVGLQGRRVVNGVPICQLSGFRRVWDSVLRLWGNSLPQGIEEGGGGINTSRVTTNNDAANSLLVENAQITTTLLTFPTLQFIGSVGVTGFVACKTLDMEPSPFDPSPRVSLGGLDAEQSFKGKGTCYIRHGINTKGDVKFEGNLQVAESIKCQNLVASGVVSVGERIKAQNVEIELHSGASSIEQIECVKLEIKAKTPEDSSTIRNASTFGIGGGVRAGNANILEIAADEIYLENCTVRTVKGQVIILGRGCTIEFVEFSNRIEGHPESKIENYLDIGAGNF